MPIYEYACQACGHALEVIQKMSDAPLKDCPACGKPQLKKLMSASGFQLKGSGWYATDHKSPSGAPRPVKTEGKEGSSSNSSSENAGSSSGESSSKPNASESGSSEKSSKSESSGNSSGKSESSSKASE